MYVDAAGVCQSGQHSQASLKMIDKRNGILERGSKTLKPTDAV